MSYDPNQPLYEQPSQPPYGQPPSPYGQPQYGAPPVPSYVVPQQQPKRSLRWLWITLGVIGGVLVLGCVGCGVALALGFNIFAQAAGPTIAATEYYTAIEQRNYQQAYTFLDTAGGSSVVAQDQQAFITATQLVDQTKGTVSSFSVAPDSSDPSMVTVTVTRNGSSYEVHLQLKQEGSTWKIINADGI